MSTTLSSSIQEAPQCIQVSRYLISEIQSGRLRAGEKLCSVRKMASRFKVGRQVILTALSILVKRHLLRSEKCRGYFVCDDVRNGYYYRVGFFSNHLNLARHSELEQLYRMFLRYGWELVPGSNYEESLELADWLAAKRDLDGVIVSGIVDEGVVKCLKSGTFPYVVMGNYDISPLHPQVRFQGMCQVGQMLGREVAARGIHRLVIICGPEYLYNERYLGETLKRAALELAPGCQIDIVHALEDSYPEIYQIMRDNPPDAFFFPGEHCMGWHRYCLRHEPVCRPLVFVYGTWIEVLSEEDYDLCLFCAPDDHYLERTVRLMLEQLRTMSSVVGSAVPDG